MGRGSDVKTVGNNLYRNKFFTLLMKYIIENIRMYGSPILFTYLIIQFLLNLGVMGSVP